MLGAVTVASQGWWRDLYNAAILEPDVNKLPERILAAQTALSARKQQLILSGTEDTQEAESLENAARILGILDRSLQEPGFTSLRKNRSLRNSKERRGVAA